MLIHKYIWVHTTQETFFISFESKVPKQPQGMALALLRVKGLILHPYVKNEDIVPPKDMPPNHRPTLGQAR